MKIVKIDIDSPNLKTIKEAVEVLQSGGLVIYPTDTAYGLGANALNKEAVGKLYKAKGRDFSKPTHVVVRDWVMLKTIAEENPEAKMLFENFLPGPLTIILKKKAIVPNILTAGLGTLGVRIPKSPVTKVLSAILDIPYTATSANLSGGETPYNIKTVIEQIGQRVDMVLDAGNLPKVPPSTIVDTTRTPLRILRKGPIIKEQLEEVLGRKLEVGV